MKKIFNETQKLVLELLLDKYENSKSYTRENRVTQTFAISPVQAMELYDSDFADVDLIRDFENQMANLERRNLIFIKRNRGVIEKLIANQERWDEYYEILQRIDKHTLQKKQLELYQRYLGTNELLDRFCQEQIDRLNTNKKAIYAMEEAEHILELCRFILENQQDILERELSIAVLGDSKLWEKKYRSKVCGLLRKYGNLDELLLGMIDSESVEDKREIEKIILAECSVYSNPSYVYFKGDAVLEFKDGQKIKINIHTPMAFSTSTLANIQAIQILDKKVMTIENLTSFNRMEKESTFLIFLSGYHNSVKQKLIRKIYDMNPTLEWYHFGDIDPDGFYIIEHLKRGTGINFKPIYMDINFLEKYKGYAKKMTNRDIQKANTMLQNGKYSDIMAYMLNTELKLEQEIISWIER